MNQSNDCLAKGFLLDAATASALNRCIQACSARLRGLMFLVACAAIAACGGGGDDPPAGEQEILANIFASCQPVPHAAATAQSLNTFWGKNFKLCLWPNHKNASAIQSDSAEDFAAADQDWLDGEASAYGNVAAIGILAHEWGHLVQGDRARGVVIELQADCLAGVFLRAANLNPEDFAEWLFATRDSSTHGTHEQRVLSMRHGYSSYQRGQTREHLVTSVCPSA